MGEGQELVIRDKKVYASEIGQKGDRIQLRVKFVSLGYHLFSRVFHKLGSVLQV